MRLFWWIENWQKQQIQLKNYDTFAFPEGQQGSLDLEGN